MSTLATTVETVMPPVSGTPSALREVSRLLREHRWAVGLTYLLLIVENMLRLLQPLLLGLAVNDLLSQSSRGLWWFVLGHAAMMSVQFGRQLYDTRVFARMYARHVSRLVIRQRVQQVETSRIAARAALSRQFISFIEQHVPRLVTALFSCIGGMIMLAFYQAPLVAACLLIAVPVAVLNYCFSKSLKRVSSDLHDRWEEEVEQINSGNADQIEAHYHGLARCWIRMSDLEARTTGMTELLILGLLGWSLVSVCGIPDILPGDIFAVFRYLMMFVLGIDAVPRMVEELARLKDIARRM